jgi:hypothetical protein
MINSTSLNEFHYEWVKFRDTAAKFPVSKIQLGKDLDAAIDIGPAMTRKILKKKWERHVQIISKTTHTR